MLAIESFKIELGEGLFIKGEVKTVEDGAAKPGCRLRLFRT